MKLKTEMSACLHYGATYKNYDIIKNEPQSGNKDIRFTNRLIVSVSVTHQHAKREYSGIKEISLRRPTITILNFTYTFIMIGNTRKSLTKK